ncbi:inner membrane CreD family protein [Coraliomargarita sp. SDUM461003]|uniref:Inner membrane CreD family protein n=1 Tax=Thalassobacterium maritimum TaxID=3041265 RepID=A0ABU1AW77_9BACT|nr:inner membrane CreD family protein [Coraliomargarita sp. SDUM461003]MDQ8207887.1 inner membrane CreD family protein [Coraliomargarita sp. SDUM461003]
MHKYTLTFRSILAVGFIFICTAVGWFILGGALTHRSMDRSGSLMYEVQATWGPQLRQAHPIAWYESPANASGRSSVSPSMSRVQVDLQYEPKRKGLFWYRTYQVQFAANYEISNPTPIAQTVYVAFSLPSADASYNNFTFELEGAGVDEPILREGTITQAVVIPPQSTVPLQVSYHARGLNHWEYDLNGASRVQNFQLAMQTDFESINFPGGTASPTDRSAIATGGWDLIWDYPDVIGAQSIGMDMPKVLNPGPIASRISFFAPVSLLFFFAVLLIFGAVTGINLHPMNYFFLAAGCFAFQLLFAYTVDLMPIHLCFFLSAAVSLLLVCGYLHAVGGRALTRIALPAQFAYMVLFSYSFFFDGLSGLTIAIGAVLTLAVLMRATAKMDWSTVFVARKRGDSGLSVGSGE